MGAIGIGMLASSTSKKEDKGQADGDGQVFHTESLGRIIWDGQGGMGGSAIAKEMGIGRASVYRVVT